MNLPLSQSNQISLFCESLKCLKELHISKAAQQVINQSIWSFKTKLPIQYEQAILAFCQTSSDFKNNTNSMPMRAMSIFKELECKFGLEKKIQQFQYFLKTESDLSEGQIGTIHYNLACFYQIIGMDAKALKTITNGPKIVFTSCLHAKLLLKLKCYKQKSKFLKGSIQSQITRRFQSISSPTFSLHEFIKQVTSCQIFELYNIGLNLKKLQKYQQALTLFQKVNSEVEIQTRTWVLSNINVAQCYFKLNKIYKAIKLLNNLVESSNFYLQPFKMQIKMKIKYWQMFNESSVAIQAFQHNYNSRNNSLTSVKPLEGKSLLKDRKLLFIQGKIDELEKLQKKTFRKIPKNGHKNCFSLLPYQNTLTKRTFSSVEKERKSPKLKKQSSNIQKQPERENNLLRPNIKMRKNSQILSINSFLNSYNSAKSSKNCEKQENQENQNKNLIDHYWSIIKNSHNEAQIAQSFMNLGDVYNTQNDFDNALQAYKKALDKGRLEATNRIGNLYYYKEKICLAAEYFEKYLKSVDGSDHQTRIKLIHCYSKNPDYFRKALEFLHKMLEANPNDVQAHILSATISMKQNHYQKAIQMCQNFKQTNAMCAQNHHLLGLIYKSLGNIKKSYSSFISALRVSTNNINSLIEITQLAQVEDFYLDLIEIYKKALSKNYKNHELFQILYSLIAKKPIKFNDISATLEFSELVAIGDFFIEKQLYTEAEYAYKQASQYTNNTLLKQKFGNLEYFKNNFQQAEQYFRESQKRKPAFKIRVKIGDTLLKQKRFKQAQEIFEECVSKQHQNKSICLNMIGQCEFGMGNYEKALQKFQKSSSLGYNKKINTAWQSACRKQIMSNMKMQTILK